MTSSEDDERSTALQTAMQEEFTAELSKRHVAGMSTTIFLATVTEILVAVVCRAVARHLVNPELFPEKKP